MISFPSTPLALNSGALLPISNSAETQGLIAAETTKPPRRDAAERKFKKLRRFIETQTFLYMARKHLKIPAIPAIAGLTPNSLPPRQDRHQGGYRLTEKPSPWRMESLVFAAGKQIQPSTAWPQDFDIVPRLPDTLKPTRRLARRDSV